MDKEKVNDVNKNSILLKLSMNATAHNDLDMHLYHLLAGDFFLRQSRKIEERHLEDPASIKIEEKIKHKAFIVNGIVSIVASLEATINSFWLLAKTNEENAYKKLKKHIEKESTTDSAYFKKIIKNNFALWKYNEAIRLSVSEEKKFPTDSGIYQEVNNFIKFRDELIHYKFYTDNITEIGSKLAGCLNGKCTLNPFFEGDYKSLLIIKYLSCDCLRWGYDNCEKLISEFYEKVGLTAQINVRQGILESSHF
ncbi:MAG TPA: hypothetical protein PK246_09550 [Saprospiraceae bacterium]|nr:hypothetical protein [Saprospiraceae bacterium]